MTYGAATVTDEIEFISCVFFLREGINKNRGSEQTRKKDT